MPEIYFNEGANCKNNTILEMSKNGEAQSRIAMNFSISQAMVSKIVNNYKKIKILDGECFKEFMKTGYFISNKGRVISRVGRLLKPPLSKGYPRICISNGVSKKHIMVHRMVCVTFIQADQDRDQINHKDGNKENNNLGNLEWCTSKENIDHAIYNGLMKDVKGEKHHSVKLCNSDVYEIRDMISSKVISAKDIAKLYDVCETTIRYIGKRKTWRHL